MRVLVACEESQSVTIELRKLGHEAFSCDLLPCSGGHPEWHIQGDVLNYLDKDWDLIIAHPPCTHLSSSGQWAFTKGIKDVKLREDAVDFFMKIANSKCKKIAIENPIGIMSTRWKKPNQIIQPWQFGDLASKSTCLWLKGLPDLIPQITEKPEMNYHTWIDKKTGTTKRMEK
jgi:site-specific DNA-cytosine methylase